MLTGEQVVIIEQASKIFKRYGMCDSIVKAERNILKEKNPELSFYFASNCSAANVKKHGQVVIESGNPMWNYWFASNIRGADIEGHRQAVNNSGDSFWMNAFDKDIPSEELQK